MKNQSEGTLPGLKPAGYDKHGAYYTKSQILEIALKDVQNGILIKKKEKNMTHEINKATSEVEEAKTKFNKVCSLMIESEAKASAEAKKASGNIRKAADDLATGLLKVQKTADFAMLEKQVALLERAACALKSLSELDKQGRLESLLKAMK